MDDGGGEYQGVETWWTRVRELMGLEEEEEEGGFMDKTEIEGASLFLYLITIRLHELTS